MDFFEDAPKILRIFLVEAADEGQNGSEADRNEDATDDVTPRGFFGEAADGDFVDGPEDEYKRADADGADNRREFGVRRGAFGSVRHLGP